MECRVYYGEYSLEHWLKLILRGNVILPKYQRYFVWDEEKTMKLIEAFKNNHFVPPVTIGFLANKGDNNNLILDGQQRLTSILLSYLGIFPDKETYKKNIEKYADENDNPDDEERFDNVLEWSLNNLTRKGKNKKEILGKIKQGNYKVIDSVDDEFLKSHYMGFSYLVPQAEDTKEQQRFYSTTFRNINIQGEVLLPQESRESLYFLNENLEGYFNPEFSKKIKINDKKMDFVRYLALLFQYEKYQNINKVAYGFAKQMEKFYEEYIYSVVNKDNTKPFEHYSEKFYEEYDDFFNKIQKNMERINIQKEFTSIIEADLYFFGLIYLALKNIEIDLDLDKVNDINNKISVKINEFKNDLNHAKNPSALKYLRARMICSIDIFKEIKNEQA